MMDLDTFHDTHVFFAFQLRFGVGGVGHQGVAFWMLAGLDLEFLRQWLNVSTSCTTACFARTEVCLLAKKLERPCQHLQHNVNEHTQLL
jgi:hypothetical protein